MKNIVLILIFSIYSLVNSQAVVQLTGTIYDQSPARNPDFEILDTPAEVVTGIVLDYLDPNRRPIYCCGDNPVTRDGKLVVNNETTFSTWFVEDVTNIPMPFLLNLTERSPGSNIWEFYSNNFFPIDGRGFDNSTNYPYEKKYVDRNGIERNFHFCIAINYEFTYRGGEYFTFAGDDDVWVFFDSKLAIDLGGLHYSESKTVYLDDILVDLVPGQIYPFDFFYCERKTVDSNFNMIAQVEFFCDWYDECGVCHGQGDTCCVIDKCPDPYNKCLINTCDESTEFQCVTEPVNCTVDDECLRGYCEEGICYVQWICNTTLTTTGVSTTGVSTTGVTTTTSSTTGVTITTSSTTGVTITTSSTTGVTTTTSSTTGTHCPIIIEPTPNNLRKACLTCRDLNCPSMGLSCKYYKNQVFSKYDEDCEPNCCEYSPTCFHSCI